MLKMLRSRTGFFLQLRAFSLVFAKNGPKSSLQAGRPTGPQAGLPTGPQADSSAGSPAGLRLGLRSGLPSGLRTAFWGGLLISLLLPGLWAPGSALAQETLEFSGAVWQKRGDARIAGDLDGRKALQVRSAFLTLTDADFSDGTIEVWVRNSGIRSFFGVGFRAQENGFEDVYLRPHNSGRFDALQYTPVYHQISAWQLYPEHNAAIELTPNRWQKLRLVVNGPHLRVFFGNAAEPALKTDRLERGKSRGGLVLKAFLPPGTAPEVYPNAFADLVVKPAEATVPYPPVAKPAPDSGLIAAWALSPSFPEPEDPGALPSAQEGQWHRALADAQGRVNIARWAARPEGDRRATVLARVVLESRQKQVARLGYGFSDAGTVFLNGRPLVKADNTFLSRSQRYLGIMRVDNDVLFLPLEKGENELVIAVSEAFGGWGVTARLLDQEGINVSPEPPPGAGLAR